ncbi:MAG TPA: hypothetical protein VGG14_17055 [Candidatus Sulfotelmatobacter sp.]|jgi:hypothetical protein
MSAKQAVLSVAIAAIVIVSLSAFAQDEKNELSGMFVRAIISDQGVHGPNTPSINPFVRSGKGYAFEVNYARRLRINPVLGISAEVPAVFNLDEKLGSGGDVVPKDYQQIFVTPAVRLNLFPETAVSFWVSVGGGFAHFSENKDLNYYGTNPGGSSTSGVLQGGLGLDLMPFRGRFKSFGIRAEGRDFWSGAPDLPLADTGESRQHNYFVGAGVIWRF